MIEFDSANFVMRISIGAILLVSALNLELVSN